MTPAIEAQLSKDEAGAHVHLTLARLDVAELQVELYDESGTSIGTYTLRPEDGKGFGKEMSLGFAPEIAMKTASARVTALSFRSTGEPDTLFNKLLGAVPQACEGLCSPTRIQCNNHCFCMGCVWATYQCNEANGCNAQCNCQDCVSPPGC